MQRLTPGHPLLAVLLLGTACSKPPNPVEGEVASVVETTATNPMPAPSVPTPTVPAIPASAPSPTGGSRLVADVPAGYSRVSADMPGLDAGTRDMIEAGDIFLLDEGLDALLIAHAKTGTSDPVQDCKGGAALPRPPRWGPL